LLIGLVDYHIRAKKTKISGHRERAGLEHDVVEYDSRLEGRVAQCLLREYISFRPHQTYTVFDRRGKPYNYTIDFELNQPYKVNGVREIIDAIEVKGVLKPHDFDRKDAWEYHTDKKMWIATPSLVRYWYEHGIKNTKK